MRRKAGDKMTHEPAQNTSISNVSSMALVSATVLQSFDPVQVTKFFKEREHYELGIMSKKADIHTQKTFPHAEIIYKKLLKYRSFTG